MALRVRIPIVSRGQQGAVPTSSSLMVYKRGTTTQIPCYAASTGGSALSQPLTPDVYGQYQAWIEDVQQVDLAETINGVLLPTMQWEAVAAGMEPWNNATYTNSWVTHLAQAQYAKTDEGIVHLQGSIKLGTLSAAAFTLPVGYRPIVTEEFVSIQNSAFGRLQVNTTGQVTPVTNNTSVFLDGVVFKAA